MQEPVILQRGWAAPDPNYQTDMSNICTAVLERETITRKEDDVLLRADLVLQGGGQGQPGYAVIEASVVAGGHDIERADSRADLLRRALTATTSVEAVVIADNLQPREPR